MARSPRTATVRIRKPAEFREDVEFAEARKKLGVDDGAEVTWEIVEDGDYRVLKATVVEDDDKD
jgi:hypothetical protein